jgi:Putative Actinobacterial Holin-X, holin superfamily III
MRHSNIAPTPQPSTLLNSLREDVSSLVADQVLLLQLKGTKKVAQVISLIAAVLLMVFLGFCVLIFLSIIGGYYLVKTTGNFYIGAGIITGIYVLLLIILMIIRKKYFQTSVANTIIKLLFDATEKTKTDGK